MISEHELSRIEHFAKNCPPSALHAFIGKLIAEVRSLREVRRHEAMSDNVQAIKAMGEGEGSLQVNTNGRVIVRCKGTTHMTIADWLAEVHRLIDE